MNRYGRLAFFVLSVLFVLAVLWQGLLAGLGLFRWEGAWSQHVDTGHFAVAIPLFMLVLALALRLGRRTSWYAGLLLLGTALQAEVFAAVRESLPVAASLHPMLGMVLFTGGVLVVRHAWALAREPGAGRAGVPAVCLPSVDGAAC